MSTGTETRPGFPAISLFLGLASAMVALLPGTGQQAAGAAILLALPLVWYILVQPDRWLTLFFATALLAPPLPIAAGNSGPHVAVAVAGVGLLSGALRLSEWRFRLQPVAVWLCALFTVLLGSVAFALLYSGWTVGVGSLARVLLFGVACYVYLFAVFGPNAAPQRLTRILLWLAAGSALFACLDFYFQWPAPAGFGPQFIWLDAGVFRRAQGVFYEASTLGNLCVFFLTMVAVAWLRPRAESPVTRLELAMAAPVLTVALILSYSRASIVALCIGVGTLLMLHRGRYPARRWLPAAVALIAGGSALTYALFPEVARGYWMRLALSVQYLLPATSGVLSGRVESWQKLVVFLAENPWHLLFGVGYKTLPYSEITGAPLIVDNMYLSLLAETGILGLGVFLGLNAAILRAAWRARASFHGAWIFSFWTGQVIQMLSGDLLTYWRVIPVYFWVLAQAVREERT